MSCMQKLYWTYENILEQCVTDDAEPLTPVGHTIQNAHIIIVIDGQGNFQTARVMPPKTAILLPATESSENRTSGEAPHPLADKIQYVAKDYVDYGGEKKAYFDGYLKQLKAWCESPFAHPKVQAVLNYVAKGRVVADLVEAGIFQLGSGNKVLNKWEAEGDAPSIFSALPKTKGEIEFGSALVCWQVEIAGDVHSQTWTDKTIQQSWADYAASEKAEKGFCLVQGEEAVISTMHPAKLRHTGDKAKLISSNDTGGYTFRGRFATAEEAASVSADVSAKAHSALRWLISRQGIRNGDQVTVSWAISGKPVPSPMKDISSEIDWDNLDISAVGNPDEIAKQTSSENSEPSPDWSANIGRAAAQIIKKKLHGYQAELKAHEQISLIMLDSATPGRMALTYYQEFLPADYFANLDAWIDDFSWYQRYSIEVPNGKKTDKRTQWRFLPPSPYSIADAVYGKSLSDTLKKQLYARLLPVIAGGTSMPIPDDLVHQSFQAACNPNRCENWEWQRNIGVACALYKGWRARHHDLSQRRIYPMSLDTQNRSRDYLYGRLLAVAENTESYALYLAGEKRATTAERYMQRFAEHPFATWRNIELALKPYQERLRNNGKDTGAQAIGEIMELFAIDDFTCDDKLSGEFLLGYHCQKMEIARRITELSANKSKIHE
ncbi:CRISPR-associated RAMP Csd1 family protein [Haemophilus haemolyticus M21127]|uniref:type I-C CRISPR-associated protein Cas8c/Csd1 n=1 Tax=Haemophilus haemolyticus TaxID=726 RepID=UPI00021B2714|nr:type I-C CRISPR-associated protein Cas8c/Csd1 [Haemophilus haemolyticus]EGT75761.1 CRISPR-associated RAMP Csd1 family protein [Haemophilus haemolyticus M21127]MBS6021843.1 type I-C CRISPR-associated protein Cas8c/Csd1 [Haemophilus haemolyticus]